MYYEEFCSLAGILWICAGILSLSKLVKYSVKLQICGLILAVLGFITRWHNYAISMDLPWIKAFPVVTMYESLTFVIIAFLSLFLIYRSRIESHALNVVVPLISGMAVLSLNVLPLSSAPSLFLPSLKSYWLIMHVTLSFIAYAMFVLSALLALIYLLKKQDQYLMISSSLLQQGTLIFTVGGIIFGAIWAQNAWGRFWAWDPKETWAFITWCVYVCLLHGIAKGWLSKRSLAWGAIVGIVVVSFTFIGVNMLFSGLHAYATF